MLKTYDISQVFSCHCDPDLSWEAISESNSEIASRSLS